MMFLQILFKPSELYFKSVELLIIISVKLHEGKKLGKVFSDVSYKSPCLTAE